MDEKYRNRIEKLYFEMYDKMLAYAVSMLENRALAEEAVQETFRLACQIPKKVCSSLNPQGWLILALRNTVRNIKRRQATARRVVEQYLVAQMRDLSVCEDEIRLHIAYKDLADTEAFQLLKEVAVEGKSYAEIAKEKGISVSAAKKRVQRAKELLRRKIEI